MAGATLHECHAACTFEALVSASQRQCLASAELELAGLGLGRPATLRGVLDALLPAGAALTSLALTPPYSPSLLVLPPAQLAACPALADLRCLRTHAASIPAVEALVQQAPQLTALSLSAAASHAAAGESEMFDVPPSVRALGHLRSLQLLRYHLHALSPGPFLLGAQPALWPLRVHPLGALCGAQPAPPPQAAGPAAGSRRLLPARLSPSLPRPAALQTLRSCASMASTACRPRWPQPPACARCWWRCAAPGASGGRLPSQWARSTACSWRCHTSASLASLGLRVALCCRRRCWRAWRRCRRTSAASPDRRALERRPRLAPPCPYCVPHFTR